MHGTVAAVGDREVQNARAAAARLRDDAGLRKRIVAYAYKVTRNLAEAKDLAQEAMMRAIDPDRSPWDPAKQPDLFLHIGSIINTIIWDRRRAEERHPVDAVDTNDVLHPDPQPRALELMQRGEENARYEYWLELLVDRLASDTVALDVLRLTDDGIDGAAAQAADLHRTVEEIYAANRRIAYHIERVKKEAPDGRPSPPQAPPPGPTPGGAPEVD